ncbi:hypothetical protein EUTSA_v10014871mg [Eutrema salsugineum]|uniref:Low-density receptor-like protein n=1 Tax=Eutrema salsugineum TaxID=72664 RepID=V4LGW9_EUTSA|nr:uncharacterized protein LOC18016909 [Eutrema salsugineum]ESQ41657.1 hypothetical protein EUTSA_v10014871mg [Eutrema salsugineum]
MASCVAPLSLSGGSQSHNVKPNGLSTTKLSSFCKTSALTIQKRSNRIHKLSVSAEYREGSRRGSSGDFVAGFLLGGAVFGAVAYIFAPQIRRSIMSEEDEYGFKKPQQPTYYDEGLEKTRETLNEKIGQLNSAIDNVSSRLRGRAKNSSSSNVPVETDPEVEATT